MNFYEVEQEDGNKLLVNTSFIVKLESKNDGFQNGAVIHLARDSVGFSSIPIGAIGAQSLRNFLLGNGGKA